MMNNYTPVIADLGMMRPLKETVGFWGGTPLYLGKKVSDWVKTLDTTNCRPDIFAAGVILYQLFYGKVTSFINSWNVRSSYSNTTQNDMKDIIKDMLNEDMPANRPSINNALRYVTKVI